MPSLAIWLPARTKTAAEHRQDTLLGETESQRAFFFAAPLTAVEEARRGLCSPLEWRSAEEKQV